MILSSPVFEHNGRIPSKYTCDGDNISPPLNISGVPEGAQSLVLFMDDPDVPKSIRPDGMWDHWVVFNIPPTTLRVAEGQNPMGVMGANTRGANSYSGPCPPDREHRYFFKLYALNAMLDLPEGASKSEVITAMESYILDSAELMGRYERVTQA
ncbi:MAG: YbhB/YbcL family Raf kinase inhibitor-like protein [Candidatus Uhrbacteria bacterium]|nr:YbhB/YbcL family Raf kinase inhibitor-like protein [Candidatus Uhrbacteria bacterium]